MGDSKPPLPTQSQPFCLCFLNPEPSNSCWVKSTVTTFIFAFLFSVIAGAMVRLVSLSSSQTIQHKQFIFKRHKDKAKEVSHRLLNNSFSYQRLNIQNTRKTDVAEDTVCNSCFLKLRDPTFFMLKLGWEHPTCLSTTIMTRHTSVVSQAERYC